MVKLTKIYTKTGDEGETGLAGQHRVKKNCPRIHAIGAVDELNAQLGFASEALKDHESLFAQAARIQNELFNLGSQLAVLPEDRRENTPVIIPENIDQLETEIDAMNESLPMLKSFILPGGGEAATRLHVARAVCRRAERDLLSLSQAEFLDGPELSYLNRLSDWLFVAARAVSKDEALWQQPSSLRGTK